MLQLDLKCCQVNFLTRSIFFAFLASCFQATQIPLKSENHHYFMAARNDPNLRLDVLFQFASATDVLLK